MVAPKFPFRGQLVVYERNNASGIKQEVERRKIRENAERKIMQEIVFEKPRMAKCSIQFIIRHRIDKQGLQMCETGKCQWLEKRNRVTRKITAGSMPAFIETAKLGQQTASEAVASLETSYYRPD